MSGVNTHDRYTYRFLCALIMSCVMVSSFLYVWIGFIEANGYSYPYIGILNLWFSGALYLLLFVLFGSFLHAFKIGVERKSKILASVVLTVGITNIFQILVSLATVGNVRFALSFVWRYFVLAVVQSLVLILLSLCMVNIYRHIVHPLQVLAIHGDFDNDVEYKFNGIPYKYHIYKSVRFNDPGVDLEEEIKAAESVLINDIAADEEKDVIKLCFKYDKRVYLVPKLSDILIKSSDNLNVMDTPLFLSRNLGMSGRQRFAKRAFDIFFSALAIILLSPVLIITAIAIKLEDKGPVFFKQERVTKDGKHFMILKFRSMIVDAEKDGRPHPAGEKDDRITKVGHVIRACRVDELPQLFNILSGDMSIVGPRPERYEHVEMYTAEIPEFVFREKVKGGLTGYAQVYGKYNTTALDKLKLDLLYITNYSMFLDIQIIFETIKILLQKESTEGFSAEKAKKMHDGAVVEEQE